MSNPLTKTEIICLDILLLTESGVDIREAVDLVLGAGAWEKIASDVYDALNAQPKAG